MSTLEQSRYLATALPGPKSKALIERKTAAVSRGVGTTMPVYAARAGGGIVEDVDGNRLIDLGSGIAVTTIGNASPRVVDAVAAQAADFTHTCFMVTPYEEYIAVCEHLNRLTPVLGEKRSALFNSGSEAVENAVKIARSYTRKQAVVAFDHAYHGRTNLTMALTAKSMPYKHGFGPFAPEIYRAPLSYPYRDAEFGKARGGGRRVAEVHRDLRADNRLDAGLRQLFRKLQCAEQVVGVGDRERRHGVGLGAGASAQGSTCGTFRHRWRRAQRQSARSRRASRQHPRPRWHRPNLPVRPAPAAQRLDLGDRTAAVGGDVLS